MADDPEQIVAQNVELLTGFRNDIQAWFDGNYGNDRQSLRTSISRRLRRVRAVVRETGCLKHFHANPPAMTGGLALRDMDPFDFIFQDYYGRSVIPNIVNTIDEAIGVLESPEYLEGLSISKPSPRPDADGLVQQIASDTSPAAGAEPARFVDFTKIDQGGSADVWRATDKQLGRFVAIKFLRRSHPGAESALTQARALARVEAPTIVAVYDVAELPLPGGCEVAQAIVMEFVEGMTLSEYNQQPGLTRSQVRAVAIGLLDALEAYKKNDLAHGDLHAKNVIVRAHAVKVLDPFYIGTRAEWTDESRAEHQQRDLNSARRQITILLEKVVSQAQVVAFESAVQSATIETLRGQLAIALTEPSEGTNTARGDMSTVEASQPRSADLAPGAHLSQTSIRGVIPGTSSTAAFLMDTSIAPLSPKQRLEQAQGRHGDIEGGIGRILLSHFDADQIARGIGNVVTFPLGYAEVWIEDDTVGYAATVSECEHELLDEIRAAFSFYELILDYETSLRLRFASLVQRAKSRGYEVRSFAPASQACLVVPSIDGPSSSLTLVIKPAKDGVQIAVTKLQQHSQTIDRLRASVERGLLAPEPDDEGG